LKKKGKIPCKDDLNIEEEGEEEKITRIVVSVFLNTVPNTPYRPQVTNVSQQPTTTSSLLQS
jgi:hypothetical protein